jgi:molybdate transport system substrate-binding protein
MKGVVGTMRKVGLAVTLGTLCVLPACRPARVTRTQLTVRGGPLLRTVFTEIGEAFSRQHPEVDLRSDFSCPPCVLTSRIQEGIDLDAFVSAGDVELKVLAHGGALDLSTRREIGVAQLVLAVPEGNPAGVRSLGDLNRVEVTSVAVGDTDATSPGHYARQAFERMGLWKEIKHKLQVTKTGCEALKSVAIGKADAAILYAFCLEGEPGKPQVVAQIPERLHDPIRLSVTLSPKAAPAAAAAYVEYLTSPAAQEILRRHGIGAVAAPAGAAR